MQKSTILLLAIIATTVVARGGVNRQVLNKRVASAHSVQMKINEEHGLVLRKTNPYVEAPGIDAIESVGNVFDCLRGAAYGLQFSPSSPGKCYTALTLSIDSAQSIIELALKAYNPTTWASILLTGYNY